MANTRRKAAAATRLAALKRLALAQPTSELQLAAKARALGALARMQPPPVAPQTLRRELQKVAEVEAISARGMAAVFQALDGLSDLEQPTPEPGGDRELPEWLFESSLPVCMGWSLSPPVDRREWADRSRRVRRIERDAETILASADPPAAYREWASRRGVTPRGVAAAWID